MEYFTPFGEKAGMFISFEDIKYNPISICRMTTCYINEKKQVEMWDWSLGLGILIPHKEFLRLCQEEEDTERGIDTIKRIYNIDLNK